jgi:hypothetical protein
LSTAFVHLLLLLLQWHSHLPSLEGRQHCSQVVFKLQFAFTAANGAVAEALFVLSHSSMLLLAAATKKAAEDTNLLQQHQQQQHRQKTTAAAAAAAKAGDKTKCTTAAAAAALFKQKQRDQHYCYCNSSSEGRWC